MELGEVKSSLLSSPADGPGNSEGGPGPPSGQGSFPPPVAAGSPAADGGGGGAPPPSQPSDTVTPLPPLHRYYTWQPRLALYSTCHCDVCLEQFRNIQELSVHFHQYHLNPHHLDQEDRRRFRLSNFLVNKHEDTESKTDFPGLYRCHECFNVFNLQNSLKTHLPTHSVELKPQNKSSVMVVSKMPSKYSREDFEDVSPRKRNTRHYKENVSDDEKLNNNHSINKRLRKRLKRTKFTDFYFEPSDDSDFDDFKISSKKNKKKHREKRKPKKRERSSEFSSRKIKKSYELESASDDVEEEKEPPKKKQKHKDKKHSKLKSSPRVSEDRNGFVNGHNHPANITGMMKKGPKQEKKWRFKILDHSKLHQVVEGVTQPGSDFLCLSCGQSFSSFLRLSRHKEECRLLTSNSSKVNHHIFHPSGSKNPIEVKNEIVIDSSKELFEYVTGAVTSVPETTFNNMHGKIVDLKTEDAQKLSVNQLNEIGLVKLNYSGVWSVKDVWESGCWEPRDDQLSWQEYELSSEIVRHRQQHQQSEAELTEKLTTQIVGRRAPLITCRTVDRRLVTSMSKLPWTEQMMVKERMDTNLLGKRAKRSSVGGEQGQAPVRQSNITSLLELVQTGKSVKYMKQMEREALSKEGREGPLAVTLDNGVMAGEWEQEHSYMCTVCGVEYDDMMEILHHKWESHPNCLVAHVNVKENVVKPPNLLFPQVGPSRVTRDPEEASQSAPATIVCSKCQQEFDSAGEGREKFHFHLLDCGGVQDILDNGKKKKKKKRGMGGGLKSTVRMLKKTLDEKEEKGTDTEDQQSPKKRARTTSKPAPAPVPLIPTHKRTTRYKETMKKEAKKQAAKERRVKAQEARVRRARISEESKIVAAVIDKVLDDVERIRAKSRRSSRGLPSPVKPSESGKTKHRRERRVTVATYKEESSDSEKSSDELKQRTPKKSSSRRNVETLVIQPPTPKLVVKVSNDEDLFPVTDIQKSHVKSLSFDDNEQNSTGDLSTEDEDGSNKPNLDCPRILKRLQTTLVTEMLTPLSNDSSKSHSQRYQHPLEVKISALSRMENGEDHSDIATDLNITVSTLGAWWIRRSDIKLRYENKFTVGGQEEPSSDRKVRNRSRSLGPPDGALSKVGSDQDSVEENPAERRKRSNRLSLDSLGRSASSAKNVYSLELKLAVIARLRAGEEIAEVARSVKVRENTVSVWWIRRDRIEKRQRQSSDTPADSEDLRPRPRRSALPGGRWVMPVEVKQTAIRRLEQGVTQAVVARDLDVPLSTVASWWRKKENILATRSDSTEHKQNDVEEEEKEEKKADDLEAVEIDITDYATQDDSNEEAPHTSIDDLGVSELEHLMSDTDHAEDKQTAEATESTLVTEEENDLTDTLSNGLPEVSQEVSEQIVVEKDEMTGEVIENSPEDATKFIDMDNVEAPEEETTLTELEADPDVEPLTFPEPSLSTTPRPQSGLALIISSYCSSDEEL